MSLKPIYFHGLPGMHSEVSLAGVDPSQLSNEATIESDAHLIGFSLGAHRALEYAAEHGARRIDLIAPAAPLQLGDFLPDMAGATVFRAAQHERLGTLTQVQGLLVHLAPALLNKLILRGAASRDIELFKDPMLDAILRMLLRNSLICNREAYVQAVEAYVQDWRGILQSITAPVTLWHGTQDTWAPLSMSKSLMAELPNATLNTLQGAGHFSAMAEVLPKLLNTD